MLVTRHTHATSILIICRYDRRRLRYTGSSYPIVGLLFLIIRTSRLCGVHTVAYYCSSVGICKAHVRTLDRDRPPRGGVWLTPPAAMATNELATRSTTDRSRVIWSTVYVVASIAGSTSVCLPRMQICPVRRGRPAGRGSLPQTRNCCRQPSDTEPLLGEEETAKGCAQHSPSFRATVCLLRSTTLRAATRPSVRPSISRRRRRYPSLRLVIGCVIRRRELMLSTVGR